MTIKRLQSILIWVFALLMMTLIPFHKVSAQTAPVVPVTVKKYAVPVANPESLENPNAWDITLSIETGDVVDQTADVVIVFDASKSMDNTDPNRLVQAKKAACVFIDKMLPNGTNTENVRVALIVYNTSITTASNFTKDAVLLKQKINGITTASGTHTQGALYKARQLLASSQANHKHIVLLSDGAAQKQYKLRYKDPNDFVSSTQDDLVATITDPQPNPSRRYSKNNLAENRYIYDNDIDGNYVAVEYFNQNNITYYYFPCNAAINEAQFAKTAGCIIHSIGLDLDNETANTSLKRIATTESYYYPVSSAGVVTAFDNIAYSIKTALTNGKVEDLIAPGFVLGEGNITDLITVSQGTVSYNVSNKTITWNVGKIGKLSTATLTYRIYADLDYILNNNIPVNTTSTIGPDVGGFDTNTRATLTYTNSNGVPNQMLDFPHPTVKLGYGVIKRHYVMVNANGQPILANGTVVNSLSEAQALHQQDFFLPEGSGHIAPKWVKLDKNNDDLQGYSVTPTETTFMYNGKHYTLTTVNGSNPSGGEVGISWKKPVGNAYFAYKEGLPPVVPVTVDKFATPVDNPLDPQNPNAWDVTLKITTGKVTVPVDVVIVIDQSSSMGGANIARLKSAIKSGQEFVRKMLPKGMATEGVRIALVSYDHEPHQLSGFTTDTAFLCQKIRALTPIWGTHTQGGLKMARDIMASSTAVYKHIILMSDGLATEQYPIKNITTNDFIGMTGNANDPIDMVIQNAITTPGAYISNDTSTPNINPAPATTNSKVGKRDLLESKYDYSNLSGRITFDGVAGALVYAPALGSPSHYYFPCNAAINEAQFGKNSGYIIHTIGYDLGDFPLPNKALELTATDANHFFPATPANLANAFNNIAQNINVGVQQGTVVDFVAPGFIIKNVTQSGDVTHLFSHVSHGTVHYDINTKKLTWNPGTVLSSTDAIITYRIYADLDYIQNNDIPVNTTSTIGPDPNGFDTNSSAELIYTNSNGDPDQHLVFPRPTVKLGYGVIKRHYVLVNKDGQPIQANGTVVGSLSEAYVLQPQDFFLPTGGDHIAPKWIKLDKTTEALQYYSVPPSKTIITTADGKRYSFVEVTGSTPNPGQIGISWKKPAGNAYFAYRVLNYWMGGTENHVNEWDVSTNWTGDQVPLTGEDVEFATTENFGTPAVADLYVPATDPKVIGNLINNSGEDLVLVTSSQLTINGQVLDNNPDAGTIVVQSLPDHPSGTLVFTNPAQNQNVGATVEFYNKGYDCTDCGMYRRSWQYFGVPVQSLNPFPIGDVAGDETINQWTESFNGNKWQPATFPMTAFRGYEITNSSNTVPSDVYKIKGTLFVGDATVPLTRTSGVNYSGSNLVGNSYTAAIDIKNAITFPAGVQQTV
ncbi:von Willebrand factor type A domain-containing protein, partial [Porphyromonas loveana]